MKKLFDPGTVWLNPIMLNHLPEGKTWEDILSLHCTGDHGIWIGNEAKTENRNTIRYLNGRIPLHEMSTITSIYKGKDSSAQIIVKTLCMPGPIVWTCISITPGPQYPPYKW
jgi:hypothetical protein